VLYLNPGSAGGADSVWPVSIGKLLVAEGSVRGEILTLLTLAADHSPIATIAKRTPINVHPFPHRSRSATARAEAAHAPREVETPVFMPVGTAATVKAVPQDVLEDLGVQILLGNTYHLYLRPGSKPSQFGGLHGFMAWPRAILTDPAASRFSA